MRNLATRILTALLAFVIVFGVFENVKADPEDETTASEETIDSTDTTDISDTTDTSETQTDEDQHIITQDEAKNAYLLEEVPEAPEVSGLSYVLYDVQAQTYLYGKDIDTPLEPASTTKLMTVLLTLENCDLDDVVTITPTMYSGIPDDYVKLGMTEGEEFTVRDLVYAALLKSCNDASLALAIHISGSEEEFCNLMNEKAAELGCTHTHFSSCYGLSDPNNTLSVSDMSKIMEKCISYPVFSEISTSPSYEISSTNKYSDVRVIQNANRFISTQQYSYDYYIGGKTGFTETARNTIVAAAKKNDRILIGVIFGAEDSEIRYSDLIKMFEFGFSKYTTVTIDENDYTTIYDETKVQISKVISETDLEITDYELNVDQYHTTLTSRVLSGYTAVIELSDVVIDPNLTYQTFDIPLYRRYNDDYTYVVGTIHLEISSKERLIEITPEKSASRNWGRFKNVIITILGISVLAIILIFAVFIFRRKNIQRRDREFRNRNKML